MRLDLGGLKLASFPQLQLFSSEYSFPIVILLCLPIFPLPTLTLCALVDSRQQVSLLAQRLSGGPGSDLQNHVLPGSGQVGKGFCLRNHWDPVSSWHGTVSLQQFLLSQERNAGDPSQSRPNPPTFAQGVISEYRAWEEGAGTWFRTDGGKGIGLLPGRT